MPRKAPSARRVRRPRSARTGTPPPGDEAVQVRALVPIAGMQWSAPRGGFVRIPKLEAERLVARGLAEYGLTPLERAVELVAARGGGIALPAKPDPELQAAVLAQGVATTEM